MTAPDRVARRALTLACTVVLVGATACSGEPTPAAKDDAPPTPAATSASIPQRPIPTAPIPNVVAKRAAVEMTDCGADGAGWLAAGTVTNTGASRKTYRITIFFTSAGATVLDYARTRVTVNAGQTRKWEAAASFAAPTDTRCVLRGVG